jgi:hypothetical protein
MRQIFFETPGAYLVKLSSPCALVPLLRGFVPGGLIGMLGLVVAVELFLSRDPRAFTSVDVEQYRFADRASRKSSGCEVLCFGDSLMKMGLAPRVIESRTGRRSFNLAIVGGQPPTTYYILRHALDADAHPEAILVDFEPRVLQVDPRIFSRGLQEIVSLRECLDLAWTARDPGFFASMALGWSLRSVRARFEIRDEITSALWAWPSPATAVPGKWRNWSVNRGAQIAPATLRATSPSAAEEGPFPVARETWECHPLNGVYVRNFLALTAARRIPVFWLVPPINPAVLASRRQLGLDPLYIRFVRGLQAEYPALVVIDGRRSGFPEMCFMDAFHLNRWGAHRLSESVATVLRQQAGASPAPAPGWVELPRYADTAEEDDLLEDADQSRLASKLDGSRMR